LEIPKVRNMRTRRILKKGCEKGRIEEAGDVVR